MCRETREICWFLHVCGIITFAAKHPTLPGFIITLTQAVRRLGFYPQSGFYSTFLKTYLITNKFKPLEMKQAGGTCKKRQNVNGPFLIILLSAIYFFLSIILLLFVDVDLTINIKPK